MLSTRRTTSLSISTPKANEICCAMRGQPQPGLRRFVATTAAMRSLLGPFGPGRGQCLGENNMRYFRLCSTLQQSGRLQNDGGTNDTCRAQEQGAHAGDDPIRGTQVGRTLAPAIEDEQLMPDQHGLGDNGTESTGPRQSGQGDDQMNEYDSEVAHPGNGINTSQNTALRPIWQFAIDSLQRGHIVQPHTPALRAIGNLISPWRAMWRPPRCQRRRS